MKRHDKCFIFFVILALGLAYTATDIYLPALPDLQYHFNVTVSQAQYTLTAYLFGLAFAQVIAGPIIDHFGYRKILLPVLSVFVLITLLCAVSNGLVLLIVMRCIQALTAGIVSVLARASFIKRFTPERAAYILTTFGPFLVLSGVFAPVIGGFISHHSNWQGVFIFLAVYSSIILFAVSKYFHVNETMAEDRHLSLTGILKTYIKILSHKPFLQCIVVNCMALGIFFTYVAEAPFIFHSLGYSDQKIGLSFIPLSFSFLLASQLNRLWYHRLKIDRVILISLALVVVGMIIMAVPEFIHEYYIMIMLGIAIAAFGLGLATPIAYGKASLLFPDHAGYAAGMITALPFIFAVVLTILVHPFCGNNVGVLSVFLSSIAFICVFLYYLLGSQVHG